MKNILYLGIDPARYPERVTHYPIIEIFERSNLEHYFEQLENYEYVIFTSRSVIPIYKKYAKVRRPCLAIGKATAELAIQEGLQVSHIAKKEQAEGVLEILKGLDSSFFLPTFR